MNNYFLFFKYLFVRIAILITILYFFDFFCKLILNKTNYEPYNQWNFVENKNRTNDYYETIIIGSSIAEVGFNTSILKQNTNKIYNLGISGYHFPMIKFKYDLYKENNSHPKNLIIVLDYNFFKKETKAYELKQFSSKLNDSSYSYIFNEYENYDIINKTIPFVRFIDNFDDVIKSLFFMQSTHKIKINGFFPKKMTWDYKFDSFKKNNPNGVNFEIDKVILEQFYDFLADEILNNVNVSIVIPPFYKELYPLINNLNSIHSIYNTISDKYGIRLYDFSDSYITDNKDLFYNSLHLNQEGATIFSNELHNKLNENSSFIR